MDWEWITTRGDFNQSGFGMRKSKSLGIENEIRSERD